MLSPVLLLTALLAATTPSLGRPTPGVADAPGVRIVSQAARWTGLLAPDQLADDSESMFLISGELENAGPTPVAWVKLGYELLADDNPDLVLASEYGYNFRAESLRGPVEAGDASHAAAVVAPLAPGERDRFRMVFFRTDVPRFDRWRVRILEVH